MALGSSENVNSRERADFQVCFIGVFPNPPKLKRSSDVFRVDCTLLWSLDNIRIHAYEDSDFISSEHHVQRMGVFWFSPE